MSKNIAMNWILYDFSLTWTLQLVQMLFDIGFLAFSFRNLLLVFTDYKFSQKNIILTVFNTHSNKKKSFCAPIDFRVNMPVQWCSFWACSNECNTFLFYFINFYSIVFLRICEWDKISNFISSSVINSTFVHLMDINI